MKKVNCYKCDYVCRPSHIPMENCDTDNLLCAHPHYDGAAPIVKVAYFAKTGKKSRKLAIRALSRSADSTRQQRAGTATRPLHGKAGGGFALPSRRGDGCGTDRGGECPASVKVAYFAKTGKKARKLAIRALSQSADSTRQRREVG